MAGVGGGGGGGGPGSRQLHGTLLRGSQDGAGVGVVVVFTNDGVSWLLDKRPDVIRPMS